ncbi:uncharacterized protein EHS24_009022 [Apiotrichum porosum]|uniref:Uncharacterized protein n=1 Tax=Apiotrichum porosum TaxID=105984 RepID=A0A427XNQ7_9TREE|nr:uncharacterized protein EHS24_009022 [Apiotrichum porosum]RSH80443.1 hypothetical protein EHS24_009022 [Apiotrichum porosum]
MTCLSSFLALALTLGSTSLAAPVNSARDATPAYTLDPALLSIENSSVNTNNLRPITNLANRTAPASHNPPPLVVGKDGTSRTDINKVLTSGPWLTAYLQALASTGPNWPLARILSVGGSVDATHVTVVFTPPLAQRDQGAISFDVSTNATFNFDGRWWPEAYDTAYPDLVAFWDLLPGPDGYCHDLFPSLMGYKSASTSDSSQYQAILSKAPGSPVVVYSKPDATVLKQSNVYAIDYVRGQVMLWDGSGPSNFMTMDTVVADTQEIWYLPDGQTGPNQ